MDLLQQKVVRESDNYQRLCKSCALSPLAEVKPRHGSFRLDLSCLHTRAA